MNHVEAMAVKHPAHVVEQHGGGKFGSLLFHLAGMVAMCVLSTLASFEKPAIVLDDVNKIVFLGSVCVSFSAIWFFLSRFTRYPNRNWMETTFVIVSSVFLALVLVLVLTRLFYSRTFLITAYAFSMSWFMYTTLIVLARDRKVYTLLPFEGAEALKALPLEHINFETASEPSERIDSDGIVLDVVREIPKDWARTLVDCQVRGIPLIHHVALYEAVTGKVPEQELSKGMAGSTPHRLYPIFKRAGDIAMVLATLPIWGPVLAMAALVIRVRHGGPVLFIQDRVGREGKIFRIVKLRTMHHRPEDRTAKAASRNDPRITPFGKLLRKYRIDELPQFWNVLKGEMSLIGPRPEQVPFVEDFEKEIPYFGYRHLVRPGITGWAQVSQGYSSGGKEAFEKLQFDLYYIRNCSLTLDLLIVFRTIQTILTGFGSR